MSCVFGVNCTSDTPVQKMRSIWAKRKNLKFNTTINKQCVIDIFFSVSHKGMLENRKPDFSQHELTCKVIHYRVWLLLREIGFSFLHTCMPVSMTEKIHCILSFIHRAKNITVHFFQSHTPCWLSSSKELNLILLFFRQLIAEDNQLSKIYGAKQSFCGHSYGLLTGE